MYVISNARDTMAFSKRAENINKQANYLGNNLPPHACAMATRGLTCSDLRLTGTVTKGRDKSLTHTNTVTHP